MTKGEGLVLKGAGAHKGEGGHNMSVNVNVKQINAGHLVKHIIVLTEATAPGDVAKKAMTAETKRSFIVEVM